MQAKYRGTIVTVESFREWREKFEDEMRLKRGKTKAELAAAANVGRLTGQFSTLYY